MKFVKNIVYTSLLLLSMLIFQQDTTAQPKSGFRFQVSFTKTIHAKPVTGRVYVMLAKTNRREPRFMVSPTGSPFWGKNISSVQPGQEMVIDETVFGYPLKTIRAIPAGKYYVQAFINIYTEFKRADGHTLWLHNDQWEGQHWNRSPGNLFSEVKKINIDPAAPSEILLICDKVIHPVKIPPDSKWVKRIKFKSKILSGFWGQPVYLGATVLLPKEYNTHPDVYYPVNYIQGHFSIRNPYGFSTGTSQSNNRWARRSSEFSKFWMSDSCPRMIAVTFQHPCPYYDDSYAVNSANVGPYDDAIMKELIPRVEKEFRIIRKPYARVLSGGSTGGWISLAMQVFHPDFFGGTFSLCPDPVDFRYHQIVNIYKDKNAYYKEFDWLKIERPNVRSTDGNIRRTMANENLYELVVGDKSRSGGQWDIWEAAFSPIGADGYPVRLWNKKTGEINHEVAKAWEKFDIRIYLENNWAKIGAQLKGKLHIYAGSMDSFYLNNALILLEDFLKNTKNPYYDGVVKYGERKPHCWGPRGKELIELIAKLVANNAPVDDNPASRQYK